MDSSQTQVFHCGDTVTYQLLCGRDVANGVGVVDMYAAQMANYQYLVVNTHDRTGIAIDAAWDVDGIYSLAQRLNVKIRGAVYTHFHFDHCGGKIGREVTGGPEVHLPGAHDVENRHGTVWAGNLDAPTIKEQCNLENDVVPLADGDVIDCGDLVLHTLHTPGHTPGSICIFAAPRCLSPRNPIGKSCLNERVHKAESGLLITGDTMFVGGSGRTDMPGGDQWQLFASLARISTMDKGVIVAPGHNYAAKPFTTVGEERETNQALKMGLQYVPSPNPLPRCCSCIAGHACGPDAFIVGRKVRIKGLQSEAGQALNGQTAVINDFDEERSRYSVRLFKRSEGKFVKGSNLEYSSIPEDLSL